MLTISEILLPLTAVILVIAPLYMMFSHRETLHSSNKKLMAQVVLFAGVFMLTVFFQFEKFAVLAEESVSAVGDGARSMGFIAAAVSVAASALGAAWAVAAAAPAAIGAISENSDNFGKAIIFVALGEGIAIYGLLISILIINKL